MNSVDTPAKIIYDYMQLHQKLQKAEAIFVLCTHDTRVGDYAAQLFLDGYAPWLIFSGGVGKLTKDVLSQSEAEVFAAIAIKAGVPKDRIIIEPRASNTGENIRFTYELLKRQKKTFRSFILVQKPYMERRTFATFIKQWPGENVSVQVTSPRLDYHDYFRNGTIDKDSAINVMVGDLQRIREYPKLGFQIKQDIPDKVWAAYTSLVNQGYTRHLIK